MSTEFLTKNRVNFAPCIKKKKLLTHRQEAGQLALQQCLQLRFAEFVFVSLVGRVGVEYRNEALHGLLELGRHLE